MVVVKSSDIGFNGMANMTGLLVTYFTMDHCYQLYNLQRTNCQQLPSNDCRAMTGDHNEK